VVFRALVRLIGARPPGHSPGERFALKPQPPATPVAEEPKPAAKPAERAKRQTFWQWLFESRVA
jgi:hypothetical protein